MAVEGDCTSMSSRFIDGEVGHFRDCVNVCFVRFGIERYRLAECTVLLIKEGHNVIVMGWCVALRFEKTGRACFSCCPVAEHPFSSLNPTTIVESFIVV